MTGIPDMPDYRTEEEPPHEEPGNTFVPEVAGEQEQDGPATEREITFLRHAEDAMNEHDLLGMLLGTCDRLVASRTRILTIPSLCRSTAMVGRFHERKVV